MASRRWSEVCSGRSLCCTRRTADGPRCGRPTGSVDERSEGAIAVWRSRRRLRLRRPARAHRAVDPERCRSPSAQAILPATKQARLLVEAREIVYNDDKNTISASGDVELNYQGRTLQADRVIYDRNTGRVFAEGNARLTEANGTVTTGSRFELTDDFKTGFIDSLRVQQTVKDRGVTVKTRLLLARAERVEGETTVFEKGTYTACEPCREHPERPPLWQVKAARIIHNNEERTIYYEDATFEFLGVPIAYVPYFWSPDPTVKRQTGFLAPHYIHSSALGTGAAICRSSGRSRPTRT